MMLPLYLLLFIVGLFMFWYSYMRMKSIERIRDFCILGSDDSKILSKFTNQKQTEEILQRTDKTLTFVSNLEENTFLKILTAVAIICIVAVLQRLEILKISNNALLLITILVFILSIIFPSFLKKMIIEHRIREISKNIPMFVDLLAVCVQAGMSIESAIKFLEGNISNINKAFAPFLSKMILKSELSGLESALDDLKKELPSPQISMMCTTLKQSLKYGSAVYDALVGLSNEIREMELLKTEEAIGKLSAKMSVPLILFFMFPVIIIIAAPGIMKVLGGL